MRTLVRAAVLFALAAGCRGATAPVYRDGTRVSLDYLFEVAEHDKRSLKVGALADQRLERALHQGRYVFDRIRGRDEHVPDGRRFLLVATLEEYVPGPPRQVVMRAELFRGEGDAPVYSRSFRAWSRGWDRAAYAAVDDLVEGLAVGLRRIEADELQDE